MQNPSQNIMLRRLAILPLLLCCLHAMAQTTEHPWEFFWQQMVTADDVEADWGEDAYEVLCEMEQEPIDVNSATREDLQRLPFLSDQQIEDIQAYVYQYGGMRSLGELAMIPSIDYNTRSLLTYFIVCGEEQKKMMPTLQNILKYGHHEVLLTGNVPFYERRGDHDGYLGYQYSHSVRYRFSYSNRLKIGVLGSQDAGEPFFANKNNLGYDNYSFYAEAHRMGCLKSLVVGRYRASFGMGLVMNNDFSLGKAAVLSSFANRTYGLRAHTSRSTADYLQGAAATVTVAHGLDVSAFVSYRKIDATLNDDSCISSIVTNGYHRTATEMNKKNNSWETTMGGNVNWRWNGFHMGATATYTAYGADLKPDKSALYRQYYFEGNDFWNVSVDYGFQRARVAFAGETATGGCGAFATINTLTLTPWSNLSVMALYRFYGKEYYAMHSRSFSEGGRVQNETGGYLGLKWQPTNRIQLTAYSDFAYFGAAKYQALHSSKAWDNMLQGQYHAGNLTLTARYRLKWRQYDNSEVTALIGKTTHRGRLTVAFTHHAWAFATSADVVSSQFENSSVGWMASQNVNYSLSWLRLGASVGYFNTDDYESRVYGYERGPLYNYSYRSYDGEGIRYSFFARADIGRSLMLIAQLSTTDYFDRSQISSGYQLIDRSSKTDLQLQVRWKW